MSDEAIQSGQEADPGEKLVHLALPVRLIHMVNGERNTPEMACTYDIHPRGARLLSFREVKVGDLVTIERGRNRSVCRVVWTGDPTSPLRGQFTVECIEGGKTPWEEELRQAEEHFLPLLADAPYKPVTNHYRIGGQNRRRSPRFQVAGGVELSEIGGRSNVEGRLEQISAHGCIISASGLVAPGTGIRMVLDLYDVTVALKGDVKYTGRNGAMGVELREIRQGDRPLLEYVFSELKKPRKEDFADLEILTDSLAAAAQ